MRNHNAQHRFLPDRTTLTTMISNAISDPVNATIMISVQNIDFSRKEVVSIALRARMVSMGILLRLYFVP